MSAKFTHRELVTRAERWLRAGAIIPDYRGNVRRVRCGVVLAERAGNRENPDAIGWFNHGVCSVLVECKAYRSDFLADRDKWVRDKDKLQWGMGRYRYYMTPPRMVKLGELPPSWGLIEVYPTRTRLVRLAEEQLGYARYDEMRLMWSELVKYQLAWRGEILWPCKAKKTIEDTVKHFKQVEEQRRKPKLLRLKRKP